MIEEFDDILDRRDMDTYYGEGKKKTNTEDSVKSYLNEIAAFPLLSSEEEAKYGKIIKEYPDLIKELKENMEFADNKEEVLEFIEKKEKELEIAKSIMVDSNLKLVVSIAKHYNNKGLSFLDLIQEGNMGLMRAVEKYDYSLGYKFSTYATWWIRQAITRGIGDYGRTVRLPIHVYEKVNKLKAIESKFYLENGRNMTEAELALKMKLPIDQVRDLLKFRDEPVSLSVCIGEDDDSELVDFLQDDTVDVENQVLNEVDYDYILGLLDNAKLDDREKFIMLYRNGFSRDDLVKILGESTIKDMEKNSSSRGIIMSYADKNTLEDTAHIYAVTRERIRQIEAKAKSKIKKYLIKNNPDLVLTYADIKSKDYREALVKTYNNGYVKKLRKSS